ncbi:MAG: heavy-metal-associated domain-containing protein [Candidatus Nanohaloarchaea archaeon]
MTDTIEITVEGKSLAGGTIGGLLVAAPNVAPLLFTGLQTTYIASNALLFQFAGVTALIATILLSIDVVKNGVQLPKHSLYSGIAAFAVIAVLGYTIVPLSTALTSTSDTEITGNNLRVATLDVEGMVCQGCRLTVKNYLESMTGTKKVTASLSKKQATVIYDSTKISAQELVDSKVFQGAYSATVKSDRKYENNT